VGVRHREDRLAPSSLPAWVLVSSLRECPERPASDSLDAPACFQPFTSPGTARLGQCPGGATLPP
jgi:hypothetical protein